MSGGCRPSTHLSAFSSVAVAPPRLPRRRHSCTHWNDTHLDSPYPRDLSLGPKRSPDASVCWCLSHRVDSRTSSGLVGAARGEYVRDLVARDVAPGVLAYDGEEVVGWAGVAPRADLPVARSTKVPTVDDVAVWSIFCVRVRPGHRGQGIAHELVEGAVAMARAEGAPGVEAVPVDNRGEKVDLTMAFVGTRALFERAGFTHVADTTSTSAGFPRVVMRRTWA